MNEEAAILAYPGNEALAQALTREGGELLDVSLRAFPDGESFVRIEGDVRAREVTIACTLHRPDEVFLRMALLAETARDLGAARIRLVAPYLSYMRQDERFHRGEGVTSRYFARLVSAVVDELITVDPHLHRWGALSDIYDIATTHVRATRPIASWVRAHVERPVIIGPDAESAQWVEALAEELEAPHVIFEKVRRGDRDVTINAGTLAAHEDHTPVILDDIVSTGRTMAETVRLLRGHELEPPVCVGVHAVFADDATSLLSEAGARQLVTCNTIPHATNAIDVFGEIAAAWRKN